MDSYTAAFHHATPHGVLAAVRLPPEPDPVPDAVLARLHAPEADVARGLRKFRQVQFVGGRLAMAEALRQLAIDPAAVLPDGRGAPMLPSGWTGSVSHKRDLALAMVARSDHGTLGVDLEDYGPRRDRIAPRVLRDEELRRLEALPPARRWIALLLRFSIKESIYKALDPWVRRYVAFSEASVDPDLQGRAGVELHLEQGEGPFEVEARYEWLHGRLVTSARIRPLTPATTAS